MEISNGLENIYLWDYFYRQLYVWDIRYSYCVSFCFSNCVFTDTKIIKFHKVSYDRYDIVRKIVYNKCSNSFTNIFQMRVSRLESIHSTFLMFVSWRFIAFFSSAAYSFLLLLFIVLIPAISHAMYQSRTTLLRPSNEL